MLHRGYILFAVCLKQSKIYSLPETNRPGSEWTEFYKNWICGITHTARLCVLCWYHVFMHGLDVLNMLVLCALLNVVLIQYNLTWEYAFFCQVKDAFSSSGPETGKGKTKLSGKRVKHGYHLVKGKSNHPMEDYLVAEYRQVGEHDLGLFAIFDGHLGHTVPDFLRSHLFDNIVSEVIFHFSYLFF